jgi:hypothetical protein
VAADSTLTINGTVSGYAGSTIVGTADTSLLTIGEDAVITINAAGTVGTTPYLTAGEYEWSTSQWNEITI